MSTAIGYVSSRKSVHALVETVTKIGSIIGLIYTAGVSSADWYGDVAPKSE
jgi:hypothetical protein